MPYTQMVAWFLLALFLRNKIWKRRFFIAGIAYLAAEYVKYLSEPGKLGCLLLVVGLFGFLGKYFEERGW